MGSLRPSKFDKFTRKDYIYSTVEDHDIWTSVFTPTYYDGYQNHQRRDNGIGHTPVLVFWHGGGFIVGNRLYEPWWPSWLLELAHSQGAMIIAPDYRLLPEATGADMVDDMHEFWTWMLDELPLIAEQESWSLRPDPSRIICAGHSAGGTFALLSALERPDAQIKAVLSLYAALDDSVPELKMSRPRKILGAWPPPPRQAEAAIRSYLKQTRGTVRTDGDPVEMWELVTCIMQQGRLPRMLTQRPDPRLNAIATIAKYRRSPPIWLIHGENDSVPSETSSQGPQDLAGLGGDSLTAVNFMGACHEAGLDIDIPNVLQAASLDDLLERIAIRNIDRQASTNGDQKQHDSPERRPMSKGLRGVLNGSIDQVEAVGPCSPMQENLIALQSLDPKAYQLQLALKIASRNQHVQINIGTVAQAWSDVVKRHAALRTTFMESVDRPGRLDQLIWHDGNPQISVLSPPDAENTADVGEYDTKFHHRLILAELPNDELFVRLIVSHALVDGVSIEVLFRDLVRALTKSLPTGPSMTCDDFLQAQQPDTSAEALAYWRQYTEGMESSFLQSESLEKKDRGRGDLYIVDDGVSLPTGVAGELLQSHNSTLANACQVAYALVLRSYTGSRNVSFSYTASGRQKRFRGLQETVGNFVSTLPCRIDLEGDPTVSEVLSRVQNEFLESLPFQGASLTGQQEEGVLSGRQIGDSLLSFQRGVPEADLAQLGLAVDVVSWEAPSDYNYTLALSLDKNDLGIRLSVWESVTSRDDAHHLVQLFRDSLDFVLKSASKPCSAFVGITKADQVKILSANGQPYGATRSCVHEQVSSMVERQPDRAAIHAWDGELTYSELETTSRRLAAHLLREGLQPEETVGICMEKSRWAPVVMLAILQAGGVVVPLGNQYPLNRARMVSESAGISMLLVDQTHAKRLQGIVPHIMVIDGEILSQLPPAADVSWPDLSPDNAAWIVFTSGSTGIPKAVVLEHKTLCSPMKVQAARYDMGPSTRALQFSAHTFDVVVKDIFTTLSIGGCVCIPSEAQRLNDLGAAINAMEVNFATLTPTVASLLSPRDVPTLDTIVSTGEALSPAVLQPWLNDGRVRWFNGYGPSECSHVSTINGPIGHVDEAYIIGLPAANRLWVVDPLDCNRLSPIGAVGELLIEGAVAREYLHDAENTAAAFVTDPSFVKLLGLAPGRRMYRTGDLVRQIKDGRLVYLGRRDTQIKIRGQRVEVGEIESRISQSLPHNPLACVELVYAGNGAKRSSMLMAAVEMPGAAPPTARISEPGTLCEADKGLLDTLQQLSAKLVDDLPLYMSRRATRALLCQLTENDLGRFKHPTTTRTVSTATESSLRSIWADVLGRPEEEIGNSDHFVQLGGDSVVAMRMVGIARQRGVLLSVADIVENPRLADMARVVDGYENTAAKVAEEDPDPFALWDGFLSESGIEQERRLAVVADQCGVLSSEIEDVYPTTPLQEGLMAMTSQFQGTYVAQQVFRLDAAVDMKHFQNAWATVTSSLTILRTRIVYTPDAGSVQVVLRDAPQWTLASDLATFLEEDRNASFGYGTPLHRFATIGDDAKGERCFIWTAHHAAYDGQTVSRTLKMVAQVYEGGTVDAVTPIPRFVRSLGRNSADEAWQRAKAYWQKELGAAQLTRFPEPPSPTYRPFADGVMRRRFQPFGVQGASGGHGGHVSMAILLRAAWALVVSASTGNNEAMLAVVLSGRDAAVFGIEDLVAPTVTTVPARIRIDRSTSVADFLADVDRQSKEMAPHTQFGLGNIRREVPGLGNDFDPGHLFVVHVGLPLEDATSAGSLGLERMTGERQNFEGYNLVVECSLDNTGTDVAVEAHFDSQVLTSAQVDELMSRLEHIAHQLQRYNRAKAAVDSVGSLDLTTAEEKKKLLTWNKPIPEALDTTIDQLVVEQVSQSPNALAVGPEVLVGVCMEKSAYAVISMLAIVKAGGGVVPLGVKNTPTQMQALVSDAPISVVIVDPEHEKRFEGLGTRAVVFDAATLESLPRCRDSAKAISRACPDNTAWIIFTSGSTGVPKGVVLEHRSLCHGILALGSRYGLSPATRTFQFSAFTFDASISDIFATLAYGGCVCMPTEEDRTDGLVAAMNDFAITYAMLTPSVVSLLEPKTMPDSLDTIVFIGEPVKPTDVRSWTGHLNVFNGYGPTECSIISVTNGPISRPEDAPLIGSNVANRLWVTHPEDYNSLVPIGSPGELLIEGPAVARHYLHDPEKTAASMLVDPGFATLLNLPAGRRIYRTGDLVHQDPGTGLFTSLGRLDSQIKIRGQRVETGEIESHVTRLQPSIQYTCVDLVSLRGGLDPMLLAAVELPKDISILGSRSHPDIAQEELGLPVAVTPPSLQVNEFLRKVRTDLSQVLPLYMVPAHFIPMKLPLTGSGKLDRRLTKMVLGGLSREQLLAFSVDDNRQKEDRKLTPTEEQLRLLWGQVLGLGLGGNERTEDDFLQLGGDSVAAMRLVAAARTAPLPIQLGVRQILQSPRLADMALVAEENKAKAAAKASVADPRPFELWNEFQEADADQRSSLLDTLCGQCEGLEGPHDIVDVQTSAYVAQQVFHMGADIDISRLHAAWNIMNRKLAILRTRIVYTAKGSLQVVAKDSLDWKHVTSLQGYLEQDQSQHFAYGTPLHRLAVVQEKSDRYFVWTVHHAAYDGWSLSVALRLLVQIYRDIEVGMTVTPIPRFIRYLQQMDKPALDTFWKDQLDGAQLTKFPALPSINYQPCAASLIETRLAGFSESLQDRSARSAAPISLGLLLRAAWAVTVSTYTGSSEATINISLSGRDVPVEDIGNIVAPTITTVPVRIKLDPTQSIAEFLDAVSQQAKDMAPFVHVGLHDIRNAVPGLGSDFDAGHLFIIQPAPTDADSTGLGSIGLEPYSGVPDSAETRDFGGYPLAVDCTVDADSVQIEMRYDSEVLAHPRAAALLSQFEHTIRQLETRPAQTSLADLDLLSPADAAAIRAWNLPVPPTTQTCIHNLVADRVTESPDAPAVESWDGQFTYRTLHDAACRLASHLAVEHAVGPEVNVGLYMDKSRWAVVSILAILMAGGAVVPLGIQLPVTRVETITRDAGLSAILADATHAQRLEGLGGEVSPCFVTVDEAFVGSLPAPTTPGPISPGVGPDNAAWVVYTSGSTGVPKGIVLEHKALCSSFAAHGPRVGFGPHTRAFQFSAYTFDNAIEDILSVLTFGGCVCVPSEDQRLNALAETIRTLRVNLVNATPTMASLLRPTDVPPRKDSWLGHAKTINTYGPAECSVDVACSAPMKQARDAGTIGLPLGVNFWVTSPSDFNRLVPVGMPGELLVEGPHLGRGYINDPEKTARAFVWDPLFISQLGVSSGRRMYRTGDLVQQNPDGSLIHLGRIDTQIKIRGQRVETGEIESNIVRVQSQVRMACVDLVKPSDVAGSGDKLLVAAIDIGDFGCEERDQADAMPDQKVRKPTKALSELVQSLRGELFHLLPRYMVPHIVPMASLPQNASGKLDRRATQAIIEGLSREQIASFEATDEQVEDGDLTPLEEQLRRIWAEMLGCSAKIGANANFQQLGGDSVTAMRIVAAAQGVGIRIGVADILKKPRLSDLARVADEYSTASMSIKDAAPFELWPGFNESDQQTRTKRLSEVARKCGVAVDEIEDVYPATALQEGLMAVTTEQPDAYFAQFLFHMHGMDLERFKAAWGKLMDSLTILRTRIVYDVVQGVSVQAIMRKNLVWTEGSDLDGYLTRDKQLNFAYGTPLHRLALIRTEDKKPDYFVWSMHHSVYDGYQIGLMLNMLARSYQDGGELHPVPPPVTRFIRYLQQKDKSQVASYWRGQLGNAHLTRFPPLPHANYRAQANDSSRRRLQRVAKSHTGAPISTLLRAAWALTVGAYTGSTEATTAIALAGRNIPVHDIGNMAMPTLTTVPMCTRFDDGKQRVSDLLASMDRQAEEMVPYLHTGMQHIRAAMPGQLGADFDPGHLLIVQPTLGAGNREDDPAYAMGLEELPTNKPDFSGYALAVQCSAHPDGGVDVEMLYDNRALPKGEAESLLLQLEHMVQQLESRPGTALCDLDLLKPADIEMIKEWNTPVLSAEPVHSCIHELVQRMVDEQPNAPAVMAWDGEMTYEVLSQTASRLAHHLVRLGVGPEAAVAGGVVVALGTQHPLTRIKTIASDANIQVSLLDDVQAKRWHDAALPYQSIVVDSILIESLPIHATPPVVSHLTPQSAAWIVYTSGSTGTPKGVVLSHQALCTGIISHGTLFGNATSTRALQFASHTFGVVIEDFFTTLIFGGCTCIPSEDQRLDTNRLQQEIVRMRINFINVTSTTASMLDPTTVPGVETVVLGGEAVRPAVAEVWVKHARVLNAYGQSECAVESVVGRVREGRDAVAIGFPIGGCAAWVVDPADLNRLVPVGAPGELLIQGPLLARGYLHDAEKTAGAFRPDGSLVYLGRADSQLKVRGQRVEPGEIESRIVQLDPEISHACVDLIRPVDVDPSTNHVLVAAIELREPETTLTNGDHDEQKRTSTMTRAPTSHLTALLFRGPVGPLACNASGKLDRRATHALLAGLRRQELEVAGRVEKKADRVLAPIEEQLREGFAKVLKRAVHEIGPDDHFIELGGDSVAAMHLVAACRQRGLVLSVRDLLQKQSIAAVSALVRIAGRDGGPFPHPDRSQNKNHSSAVTDIQEWMLNYHVTRPDVGMTYFSLDGAGPLVDERMADACRKLLASVEILHTGFVQEAGTWKRVVLSPFTPEVRTYVTEQDIDEWTVEFMGREGSKPMAHGQPLADIALVTTDDTSSRETGRHRILMRLSHAIWDGMCMPVFWAMLKEIYESRGAKKGVDLLRLLEGAVPTPIGSQGLPRPDDYVYPAGVLGPKTIPLIDPLPFKDATCSHLIKAAWSLTLARHAGRRDVVFADLVSGRAGTDASVADALGCCSTPIPVRVQLAPHTTYRDLVRAVRRQQLDSMPHETHGFGRIARDCAPAGPDAWPGAMAAATSWINHVPTRVDGTGDDDAAVRLEIGEAAYALGQPGSQAEKRWTFSEVRVSWTQNARGALEFHLVYATDRIAAGVARRLYDDLAYTVGRILASPDDLLDKQLLGEREGVQLA
ncbi:hypothetical protein PG987_010936 [Apiospora arundinis]